MGMNVLDAMTVKTGYLFIAFNRLFTTCTAFLS